MAIQPVVRYMILCNDWELDDFQRINVYGLISTIHSYGEPPFPILHSELCVLLLLTEAYGTGEVKIAVVFEETGDLVFETYSRPVTFGNDPLAVRGIPFRIRNCLFPTAGVYSVQFCYDDECVEERSLLVR